MNAFIELNQIINSSLDRSILPWVKRWPPSQSLDGLLSRPINMTTRRRVSLFNTFILSCYPYENPVFLNHAIVEENPKLLTSGSEKPLRIFYYEEDSLLDFNSDGQEELKIKFEFTIGSVFNLSQTTLANQGLGNSIISESEVDFDSLKFSLFDVLTTYCKTHYITMHMGETFSYNGKSDKIFTSNKEQFNIDYVVNSFRMCIRSTAHSNRLDRVNKFVPGSTDYLRELLIENIAVYFLSCDYNLGQYNSITPEEIKQIKIEASKDVLFWFKTLNFAITAYTFVISNSQQNNTYDLFNGPIS